MPPLVPSRILAIRYPYRETRPYGRSLDTVARLDLALRDLFERDREVVLGRRVHHRRRKLLEDPLAERVVVVVDLPRPLRRDDHRRVVRVHVLEQTIDA